MKKRILKYILWMVVLLFGAGLYSLNADYLTYTATLPELELLEAPEDTIPPRYPVSRTSPQEYEDIVKQSPADLRTPDNVKTTIEYDIKTGAYIVRTKLGDKELGTPMTLTPEEYQDYSMQQSLRSYFRQKNEEEFQKEANKQFNLTDMQFNIGAADRIFGPGGVRVKTQGSAELTMGLKNNKVQNPSLPERARNRTFFNFDESVQLNMQASVGSKVNFGMNYNTETSFDFDSKKLKLAYTGEEDEIIKSLEAGNVSMTTSNSLINGGAALFGIKADLQFGKLRVNALFAQQNSESKTVNSKGGVQTKPFELTIDQYDENRHFFLAHYFRDTYDDAMKKLPYISSSVSINRIEVWITNKRSNYDQSRNIVAFSDLAERNHISNPSFVQPSGSSSLPANGANTLYSNVQTIEGARQISTVNQALGGLLTGGKDYEEIESARRLDDSEYTFNKQLGYISLKTQLQPDEVLAVAFEYTSNGQVYQVGEFSTDNSNNTTNCLFVKLLKGVSTTPDMPFWDLMMKNVYSLGAYSVQKEKFKLDIMYQSDSAGTYVNYIPEPSLNNQIWLKLMNLDRLDSKNEPYADGFFDFVDGYTVQAENGKIIFPVVEPFGSNLKNKIGNAAIANKYIYQELYDSTLTVARQIAEKNKFIMRGEYKASSGSEIQLGATNVARGSVKVTAGGATLTENVDYTVDYTSGTVTILNESIISSGTPVSVSLENQSVYNMQRKTMVGLDLNYQLNKDFNIGATVMHMSEMPLTTKVAFGDESINNTLWGLNASYKGESQWLTNMFDKLPLLTLTKPSQISFNAEFAHLIAGHYENKNTGGYSYLDDFESTQSGFDLLNPYPWNLASTPSDDATSALFPEAKLVNDVEYGKNRALLAWYYIDGIFTRKNSSSLPRHLKEDKEQLSNHYVRAVYTEELFPNKDLGYNENNTLSVLNLAYYPNERGPYNLDADDVNSDGTLAHPEKRWGGIMRKIDQSDFETANIEYIEFWLLDPFIYDQNVNGGDLYFNLGEISEDILKDEKKFFENGLPVDGDQSKVETTVWGKVPRQQSTVYAFDNTAGARQLQDVGLNGLSTTEELGFETYTKFIEKLRPKLSAAAIAEMENDPFSVLNDPASDNYHYFRGEDYDEQEKSILERYKRYNGTEGNSEESTGRYNTSAKNLPDVEDLNQDNTLNKNEKYYEYKVSVRPKDMVVGSNFIVDKRESNVKLVNGTTDKVTWYQFKIPVKKYDRAVGGINNFKTIRFMRMYLTDFKDPTVFRFGTFQLVRGDWRSYEQDLSNPKVPPTIKGTLEVSTVNIEENGDRQPVNYILPPGISRMLDPSQPQLIQQNEQSLSLKVTNLAAQDARAVYKSTYYDLRQYKRMQLFVHAEALNPNVTELKSEELSVFIRLGSDYKNNYYEYEVPLKLTPHSDQYSSNSADDREAVWPTVNTLNFSLETLTNLKTERNRAKRSGQDGVTFQTVYSSYDKDNPRNKISVVGNPSLSEVKTIMIGVRNNSKEIKSAEVWVNELRLTDFNESGGWAANANLNVALSDLGTVNLAGRIETAGFGALDQSLSERRLDDYSQYSVSTSVELGKLFPEKAKVSIPLYYAYSKEVTSPQYNPLDQDIKLSDAMDAVETKAEKDSIKEFAQDRNTIKSISFNNVRVNIQSKNPMPYDPANFSFGYSYSENNKKNPDTEYETTKDYRGNFAYNYTPYVRPFRPFEKLKKNNGYTRYIKQLGLNYVPSNISFQTALMRSYYEIQLRDLTSQASGGDKIPVSFSQNFYWDRAFSLRWDFTNNLSASFTSGTNARIEEPHVQVNKKLNPDDYQVWKDSVKQSIADLGTPMKYDQSFSVTWNMPLQYIPVLDWVNSSFTYNAAYNWDRGAEVDAETEIGNTIKNQRQFEWQGSFNMQSLYNKNKFLKKVNQKFSATRSTASREREKKKKEIKLEKEIQLNLDSGTVVQHGMFTKKVRITARGADGRMYSVKYKPINYAEVMILNKDTAHLKLTIYPGPKPTEDFLYKSAEYASRFLMMIRRVNVQYSTTAGMMLPGFRPEIGDIFGQKRNAGVMAPGLGFAFGSVNRDYINDAADRGWLVMDSSNVTPAMINNAKTLNIRANLEPIPGLKIDLNASRVDTRNTEIRYMYDGMPETQGGSFTMTTIALKSAFGGSGNAGNGYSSKAFDNFLSNRSIIAARLENMYAGTSYPNAGFIAGTANAGRPYEQGGVGLNSTDVLIPAFLAAYTGKNPNKVGLTAFPSLASLLPNWRITYDGLIKIPTVKKYFKSMMLSHQYRCSYSVGTFSSFLNWVDAGQDGLGYVRDVLTGNPTPSSPYEISAVSITEGFSPLLGVDATLLNNVTARAEYRTTRNLSLNISSYQLVEALSNEFVIGLGYKMTEFNKVLKMKKTRDFSNDLTVRLDFSFRKMQSLIRKIEDSFTQATSGNIARTIQFSADYGLSRALTLRAFYDLQVNKPLVSSASYPTSNSNYGISVRFSLAQ
ncbi:cell surface protein SprA [Parabacteroides bouchesdurhonensis]|uniref:T9SS outer membrane translocon Sov/SprA n=1 Tax=Parabacteroides bouchesdurhonensis TaxID=1936995 RepID=UPI000E50CFDE|nr:cell surface protein SprA [Parabacteroides bouchesdurhonensis]RHJ90851.1 cell surface protein SprA [Bacteroides sp. AM07-16]